MTCPKCKGPVVKYQAFNSSEPEWICADEDNCEEQEITLPGATPGPYDWRSDWLPVSPPILNRGKRVSVPQLPPPSKKPIVGKLTDIEKKQIIESAFKAGWITASEYQRRMDELDVAALSLQSGARLDSPVAIRLAERQRKAAAHARLDGHISNEELGEVLERIDEDGWIPGDSYVFAGGFQLDWPKPTL